MKLSASREQILGPLQSVIGVVERKQTMPVLANVLLSAGGRDKTSGVSVTGTDLEVELVAAGEAAVQQSGEITIPGRKLLDIFRALPEKTSVTLSVDGDKVAIRAGRSRFSLSSLPASDFPVIEEINSQQSLIVGQADLRRLIDKTHFSMAQQDVRYYLNGTLFETDGRTLRAVATDGHRLAICETALRTPVKSAQQVIVPRKGILELQRILDSEGDVELSIGTNHIRATIGAIRFTSKLIDGKFPEYSRVIPANPGRIISADRALLRQSLQRTAILSNEKYRGVRLSVRENLLTIQAHNPEQEEAEDQVEVSYKGEEMEIGFNVNYLLDALTAVEDEQVEIGLIDSNSSCLIRSPKVQAVKYVVMPMRL
jgi:DNA polymerase-3 subunit beta